MTPDNDRELAVRAAQGDGQAFGELIQRYQSAVFNVAFRMMANVPDADDVTQETFIRAYRAFSSYDPEKPIGAWLKTIAVRVCLTIFSNGSHEAFSLDDEGKSPAQEVGGYPFQREPDPEEQVQVGERDHSVRMAIIALPPHYRAIIELRHFQELSYEEIAQTLHCPVSTVKINLFRARRMLAERLAGIQKSESSCLI
jgi:RNA polymerase sigma-70 factor (ECF subfamily)